MTVQEIKDWVRTMNIDDDENSLCFKSAVILMYLSRKQIAPWWHTKWISQWTGYSKKDVRQIIQNLSKNGIVNQYKRQIYADFFDEKEGWMEFILCSMCGAGLIRRCLVDENEIKS
jgi:hypothetical protein